MNTEILKVLQAVQQARQEVANERANPDLSEAERRKLEPLSIHLSDLERALLNETRDGLINALTQDAEPLRLLTEEIKVSIAKLERVASIVEAAAEKVEALIKIIGIASRAGLF